jgi:HEPN domain-containing protein
MAGDPRTQKPIARLLEAANLDLDAAQRLLQAPPNLLAANHLQQAAEKILSAARSASSRALPISPSGSRRP